MKLTFVNPEALGVPKGYSNGVRVEGGADLLFVAGQIAWDSEQRIVSDDFATQFGQALENVVRVVREAGGEPRHIVRLTMYATSRTEYLTGLKQVGALYRATMGRHYPAMALVEVSALLEPGAKIEIEATAALPRRDA